jgi:class 3 adenylate cyclase
MRAPLPRLPSAVPAASNLQADLARSHSMVSILFADIAGFTNMCSQLPPATVVSAGYVSQGLNAIHDVGMRPIMQSPVPA